MSNREWYSYHFPELVKIVSDNYMYARTAQYIKSRKDLTEDSIEGLEEIVMDSAKAKAIYDASKSSMGKIINEFIPSLYIIFVFETSTVIASVLHCTSFPLTLEKCLWFLVIL